MTETDRARVAILGAGGRDFHVFNTRFRHDPSVEVVAFTAAQIPHIEDRRYPPVLSGPLYPDGIPILPEHDLEALIRERGVREIVFAYSDAPNTALIALRERSERAGASFRTFDPVATQLPVARPSAAVCAVRTGCGKSGVARYLAAALREQDLRVAVLRHPMPYGQLEKQVIQRFLTIDDLGRNDCTIEEMEEYEPHIRAGSAVYAGADYLKILGAAEAEADAILWDGGNNDAPFLAVDVLVTLLDPLRAGDELTHFPSRWNLEHADVLVVAKTDQATDEQIDTVLGNASDLNPGADVVMGSSPYALDSAELVKGKRALVIEDGPTTTHGGMAYGAGMLAAKRAGASEIVDPRPYATGEIAETFAQYGHLREVLPALGYGAEQLHDLEQTIRRVDCDVVVVGTPIDLSRVVHIDKPTARASYEYADVEEPRLDEVVLARLRR